MRPMDLESSHRVRLHNPICGFTIQLRRHFSILGFTMRLRLHLQSAVLLPDCGCTSPSASLPPDWGYNLKQPDSKEVESGTAGWTMSLAPAMNKQKVTKLVRSSVLEAFGSKFGKDGWTVGRMDGNARRMGDQLLKTISQSLKTFRWEFDRMQYFP